MISAVVRPFRLALLEGAAEPPPERSRAHLGVVQVLDLAMAATCFLLIAGQGFDQPHGSLMSMLGLAAALPIVLRDRWPLGAWRVSLLLVPLIGLRLGQGNEMVELWPSVAMWCLVLYAVAVRCERDVTVAAWVVTVAGLAAADLQDLPITGICVSMAALLGHTVRLVRASPAPAPRPPTLWRWPGQLKRAITAVLLSFRLALFDGDPDPPQPRGRRLMLPMPRWTRIERLDLVQALDFVIMWVLFGTTLNDSLEWNNRLVNLGNPLSLIYFAAIAVSLPVLLRNRWPLAAWRASVVMLPLAMNVFVRLGVGPYSLQMMVMYLLVGYSVAVRSERRVTIAAWLVTALAVWIAQPETMPIAVVVTGVAMLFGYNVRARRLAASRLTQVEERSHQAEAAQAVLEERARIARELHDIVAHHMSVIAIHAEAVPLQAAGDPERLEKGLAEIRGLSLEAIAQLRQVLGVLRDEDGRADTAPQPGLDRIGELVANARAAGLKVTAELPDGDGVPPAVGLSAYRIVQESLSNAMRHSPGASVRVELARDERAVRLRVANGAGARPGGPAGAGQGVVGMRERAALLGGSLEAGRTDEGGFEVTAMLPIAEEA
ncbi:MAG: hypothetical protein HOY71_21275 [Nonomuraea sp.]|nr:hypothetical protein [Nonomuraea sp.]